MTKKQAQTHGVKILLAGSETRLEEASILA
jgi:hypothetical protein